jgi:hypothetical protein
MLVTALVGTAAAEDEEEGAAPEQVGTREAMGRGRPEGMMPEGRQAGMPAGREPVAPDKTLVGRATAVEAKRAAEKANDFILSNERREFEN